MKGKALLLLSFCALAINAFCAQTTYTFTSKAWASKVGTVLTDGKTDGWVAVKDAHAYQQGYDTPQGVTNRGMQVTAKTSGAEALSVVSFNNVRSLRINYCTNNKAGAGTLVFWIGGNDSVVAAVNAPDADGNINRDIELRLPEPQSGKIRFKINCTANSLYINSLNIKADNAGPSVGGLTRDIFRIVTGVEQLQDGDEVMFGVADPEKDYVMGVFDENISRNNIHALHAVYSSDRSSVNEIAEAVYTLQRRHDGGTGTGYFTFRDYTGWYAVASGGNPNNGNNNYLTAWDTVYSPNYGLYGGWDIAIADGGEATLRSLGRSRSSLLQFNPNGTTPIFACYNDFSQTAVALYKREKAPDEGTPYIQTGIINFGTAVLDGTQVSGSRTIEINAANLTDDISVRLKQGSVFAVNTNRIDRDGDFLTVSYTAAATGFYKDTLLLSSGTAVTEMPVLLNVQQRISIAEARLLSDQSTCLLNPLTVTKKYDKYIFVQDATGAMLIFDGSNQYGKDLVNGCILTGVTGKYRNYYGNPTLTPTAAFQSKAGSACLPQEQTVALTEDDACRYIRISNTLFNEEGACMVGGTYVGLHDLFNCNPAVMTDLHYDVEAVVYNYNGIVLCPVSITPSDDTAVRTPAAGTPLRLQAGVLLNPQHQTLCIYGSNGTLLLTTDGDADLSRWQAGLYIARTGNTYLKFILH